MFPATALRFYLCIRFICIHPLSLDFSSNNNRRIYNVMKSSRTVRRYNPRQKRSLGRSLKSLRNVGLLLWIYAMIARDFVTVTFRESLSQFITFPFQILGARPLWLNQNKFIF